MPQINLGLAIDRRNAPAFHSDGRFLASNLTIKMSHFARFDENRA